MNWRESDLQKVWASISSLGLKAGLRDATARWLRKKLSAPHDVLREYGWVLNENRPAELPAPEAGPLRINWVVPGIARGNGGLLNVFRAIYYLEQWGHKNGVYTLQKSPTCEKEVRDVVKKHYFPVEAPIEEYNGLVADSDALVATNWQTAYAVRSLWNTAKKFYFVQDVEHLFHPAGSLAEFAKETYRWGFQGITLGRWIAEVLHGEFGMECTPFGFSYDRAVYSCEGDADGSRCKNRLLFYARPNTERRGFELGMLALSLVAKKRPDTEFVLVGFPAPDIRLPFRAIFPGILPPKELAALYRSCTVALVLSHTNLSMLPLELMACGCPVVSNTGRNVEWLLSGETTQLARPTPHALADAILELLDDERLRMRKARAGFAFSQQTDWAREIRRIESAFYEGLRIPVCEELHA